MLGLNDLCVPCQPDRQGWFLPNEASKDLDPSPSSLLVPHSLSAKKAQDFQHSPTHQKSGRLRKDETYCFLDISQNFSSVYSFRREKRNPLGLIKESLLAQGQALDQRIRGKCRCQSRTRMSSPGPISFFSIIHCSKTEFNNVQSRFKYKYNYPINGHLMEQETQLQRKQVELICKFILLKRK